MELHRLARERRRADQRDRQGRTASSRTDLASNQYTSTDPRLVLFNTIAGKGVTPFAVNFNARLQRPTGPVARLVRDAVFGDRSKIDADNDAITSRCGP